MAFSRTHGPKLPYANRAEAGRALAEQILDTFELERPVVLALPRGGVPVAFEVSERLHAPLDVIVVRKLGVPGHEELAMGAIGPGGVRVMNDDIVRSARATQADIDHVAADEQQELERREQAYRGGREPIPIEGRQVILVDDGLATGASIRVAALAAARRKPEQIIVASPVGAAETCAELDGAVDQVLCAATPSPFYGVGQWYRDFRQTTDDEVQALLERSRRSAFSGDGRASGMIRDDERRRAS
jgi:putative phosphoribosyl transferase